MGVGIQVDKVNAWYGKSQALYDISLQVKANHATALIGPSGCGKSTFIRCINRMHETIPEARVEGSIRIGELDAYNGTSPTQLRRRVGMVFQQFNLFPHMTVLDNVLSGPRYVLGQSRAAAEPEARRLLDRVGLGDKLLARPEQLSGGQQQRVAIARALAVRPEAILFDEPTSALDPRMAGEVLSVIADLAKSGQTMIVVTHAMHFARQVAHTVHVMDAGRIVESGPPAQVFDAPREDATQRFVAETRS